jgi:hypothetical protein
MTPLQRHYAGLHETRRESAAHRKTVIDRIVTDELNALRDRRSTRTIQENSK